MGKDALDRTGWAATPRDEDRRLWWQKLADGIAEVLAGAIQFVIDLWKWWNRRSRWWWGSDDDV
jgi:hypothetical protein